MASGLRGPGFGGLKRRFPTVVMRAMNRAATSARADMSRQIASDTGLKVGDVRDQIRLELATTSRLVARLTARGRRVPLIDFKARGPEPSRGRGRGVSVKLPGSKSGGRYPHAFIATMRSGHRGVFKRVGTKRLPIVELFGPSLVRVFLKFRSGVRARAIDTLKKNIESGWRFALRSAA